MWDLSSCSRTSSVEGSRTSRLWIGWTPVISYRAINALPQRQTLERASAKNRDKPACLRVADDRASGCGMGLRHTGNILLPALSSKRPIISHLSGIGWRGNDRKRTIGVPAFSQGTASETTGAFPLGSFAGRRLSGSSVRKSRRSPPSGAIQLSQKFRHLRRPKLSSLATQSLSRFPVAGTSF